MAGNISRPRRRWRMARQLMADGADILDIGAASSNPDAKPVAPDDRDRAAGGRRAGAEGKRRVAFHRQLSRPRCSAGRWRRASTISTTFTAFPMPRSIRSWPRPTAKLIVMHSVQEQGVATRVDVPPAEIFDRILRFFERRIAALTEAGIARDRLILDPGMGFFLGSDPENSLTVLRRLPELKARFGLPVLVSVSRKSFLRKLTGQATPPARPCWPPAWPPSCSRSARARTISAPMIPAPWRGLASESSHHALDTGDRWSCKHLLGSD